MRCLLLLGLFVCVSIISQRTNSTSFSEIFGIIVLLIGVFAGIGFTYAVKGLREASSAKKWMGLLINTICFLLVIGVLLANGSDILRMIQ